ncbi:uncharacterized protein LOC115964648 [Quercus lobata]|uniref:uncharacterized protein LOC115964648 n=1 Tax=Quercus lobata TaxID=97700 RepID=UPI0012454B1D|nr:uncharacterized protein LOC115964648 [Quercus lobata]
MDPLKYLMENLVQDGKTTKWVLLLSKIDIKYMTQKSIKGRAIADHLAHCSLKEAKEIQWDFPDEDIIWIQLELWKMLNFPATNNATESEACIMRLQAALGLGVKDLEMYGDSALIISLIKNRWKIKEEKLLPYYECLQKLASKFGKIQYQYVPRMQNQIANALSIMASMMDCPKEDQA